jgi:hypothetical protein
VIHPLAGPPSKSRGHAVNEPQQEAEPAVRKAGVAEAIRASALGLLIGGGICLFIGLTWGPDAPGSVSEHEAQSWFARDRLFYWCLRIIGVGFLVAAALAGMGKRVSMLLAVIVEVVFALLMLVMMVEWTIEARVDGAWEYSVILLILLAVISLSGARRSWELYNAARPAADLTPDEHS